jgi:hypothetical protein
LVALVTSRAWQLLHSVFAVLAGACTFAWQSVQPSRVVWNA